MDHVGNDLGPILLTGAAGYLGRHVLEILNARGLFCIPTSFRGGIGEFCDLTNVSDCRVLLERTKPSAVIHCAAIVPKTASGYEDDLASKTSLAMLKSISDNAACRVVLASSMAVYDAATHFPAREDGTHSPAKGYARGKWMAEMALLGRNFPDDVVLRLPGLFGLPRRSGLLYNAAKAFLGRGEFELTATSELWAAMAVKDAAEYMIRAAVLPSKHISRIVNVGYEGEFSVLSAVAQIADCCRTEWNPPPMKIKPFSMHLGRLASRYGLLAVTFRQRLAEFVDAVRVDLEQNSKGGINAG